MFFLFLTFITDPGRVRVTVRLRPKNAEDLLLDADFADCVELQPEVIYMCKRKFKNKKRIIFMLVKLGYAWFQLKFISLLKDQLSLSNHMYIIKLLPSSTYRNV